MSQELTTIYLDPERWLRGLGSRRSKLWNPNLEKGCCIGLGLIQLGIKEHEIQYMCTVRGVIGGQMAEVPPAFSWMSGEGDDIDDVYNTNDRIGIPPAERVEKLNRLTEPHGLRFVLQETPE